jgi:SAM-dependent methyltransferase
LLPLTLAEQMPACQCVSTDILEREVRWTQEKSKLLKLQNLKCQHQDARQLSYPSDYFDLITSISVFEHIAPEQNGDIPAINEMARVLKPGGFAIITVPFSLKYFVDYQTSDVYERQSRGQRIFFQRFYDEHLLQRNFVQLAQLNLCDLSFIEERFCLDNPRKRITHLLNGSPARNLIFGPMFPLLSHVFLSPPRPLGKCRKPYIACMVLRKPKAALRSAA